MSKEIKNFPLWLQGVVYATLKEDIANDGFSYTDLARFVDRETDNTFWLNLSLGQKSLFIKKAIGKLRSKKNSDVKMKMQGGVSYFYISSPSFTRRM